MANYREYESGILDDEWQYIIWELVEAGGVHLYSVQVYPLGENLQDPGLTEPLFDAPEEARLAIRTMIPRTPGEGAVGDR